MTSAAQESPQMVGGKWHEEKKLSRLHMRPVTGRPAVLRREAISFAFKLLTFATDRPTWQHMEPHLPLLEFERVAWLGPAALPGTPAANLHDGDLSISCHPRATRAVGRGAGWQVVIGRVDRKPGVFVDAVAAQPIIAAWGERFGLVETRTVSLVSWTGADGRQRTVPCVGAEDIERRCREASAYGATPQIGNGSILHARGAFAAHLEKMALAGTPSTVEIELLRRYLAVYARETDGVWYADPVDLFLLSVPHGLLLDCRRHAWRVLGEGPEGEPACCHGLPGSVSEGHSRKCPLREDLSILA